MRGLRGASATGPRPAEGGETVIIPVLIFAAATFFLSFLIGKSNDLDRGKVAVYVTLIAWGSLLYGLLITKAAQ